MRGPSKAGASYHVKFRFSKVRLYGLASPGASRLVCGRMPLKAIDQRLRPQEEEAGRVNFDPLKGAMIGAGRFARFQAEAWRRVEGAQIVAVADAAPGRAEEFSERFGIARAYC